MDTKLQSLTQSQTLDGMEFRPADRVIDPRERVRSGPEGVVASIKEFEGSDRIEVWLPKQQRKFAGETVDQLVHVGTLNKITVTGKAVQFELREVSVRDRGQQIDTWDLETFQMSLLDPICCEFHHGKRGLTIMSDFFHSVDFVTIGEPEEY